MSASDGLKNAKTGVEIVAGAIAAAGEVPEAKAAAKNLAKSAETLTALIDNCLLPIAAVNFAFERGRNYFAEKFPEDIAKATEGIPPSDIVEPKASVAAPVLQGLGFSHEEPDLKKLYLRLLATSMDARVPDAAHPSFSEIIKQLSSAEAPLLSLVLQKASPHLAIAMLSEKSGKMGERVLYRHLFPTVQTSDNTAVEVPTFPAMVENWSRLGLVEVDYTHWISEDNAYDWVKGRPEYEKFSKLLGEDAIVVKKGILVRTAFGSNFMDAAIE